MGLIGHSTPAIYIKEDGKEAIFIADSKGIDGGGLPEAKMLQKKLGIPVYVVEETRQTDFYSCFTDTVVITCDATAIDPETKKYRIPNLLKLIDRNEEKDGYHRARLPDELLRTAQYPEFMEQHQEKSGRPVHKKRNNNETQLENLSVFRKRYERNVANKTIDSFLYFKGIKFAHLLEIRFYIKQLRADNTDWNKEAEIEFTKQAKRILNSNSSNPHKDLFVFAQDFPQILKKNNRLA